MTGQSPLDTRLASLGLILGALAVGYYYLSGMAAAPPAPAPAGAKPRALPPSAYTVPDSTIVPGGPAPYLPTVIVPR